MILALLLTSILSASEPSTSSKMEVITVYGDLEAALRTRQDADSTEINERASAEELKRFGAQSLADAVKALQGVDTQTFCANCGAKRVTINGLRGEHTTVLVDGIPVHSSVSSFYGLDTVPMSGVEEIQVKRGAGNALTSPEAIGGTINLITRRPLEHGLTLTTQTGVEGTANYELMATAAGDSYSVLTTIQRAELQPWDIDGNGVAESPFRRTQNLFFNFNTDINPQNNINFRFSNAWLRILGGTTTGFEPANYPALQASGADFIDGDVRQRFIGDDETVITELVDMERREFALHTTSLIGTADQLEFRLAKVDQFQDSIYAHGYDYDASDEILFGDVRYVRLLPDNHLLTAGVDAKNQSMSSDSDALYVDRAEPLTKDNFSYQNRAVYLMDEWESGHHLSIAVAARLDQINVQWSELGNEVSETLVSPRFKLKYDHTHHLTSRFSYGQGYRPPLTIFESQHGNDHDGFVVEINQVERAESAVYSLSANHPTWFVTGAAHATRLRNMAYGEDRVSQGLPTRFINSEESFDLLTTDLVLGGIPTKGLDVQISIEQFQMPDLYAYRLPTAAIEQRVKLDTVWAFGNMELGSRISWIGSRDLSRFGYEDHYNVFDDNVSSATFGEVQDQKGQTAPEYWLMDLSVAYQVSDNFRLSLIVNNVFDYTQTGAGDSPTTWHQHAADDVHFDNFHTWGPLRGREYIGGLQAFF